MKMVSKFKTLLLPLILLSSCTNNTPKEEVEIVISALRYGREIKETINSFLEENKLDNVKVRIEDYEGDGFYPPYGDFKRDINVTSRSELFTDVMYDFATELDQRYLDIVNETVDDKFKEFGMIDGKYFGIPISFSSDFLYYNSAILGESDIVSLENIIKKLDSDNKLFFPYPSPYCSATIAEAFGYVSIWEQTGPFSAKLLEDNLNSDIGINFLKIIKNLMENPNIVSRYTTQDGQLIDCCACIDDKTSYQMLKEMWGDNLKCASLPAINVNESSNKLLSSFFSPRVISISKVVKDYSKYKQDIIYKIVKEITKKDNLINYCNTSNRFGYPTCKMDEAIDEPFSVAYSQNISYWTFECGSSGVYYSMNNLLTRLSRLNSNYTDKDLRELLNQYDLDNLSGSDE